MSIKTNGTGSRLTIDLTATHDIAIGTDPMTMAFWCKHTINFADFEGFGAISAASDSRSDSVETHNNGVSGATGQFGSSVNSSGIGLTTPNLPVNTWFYVMISRPSGGTTTDALIRVRISGANTNHLTLNWTHTGPFRFITLGDLAAFGLVTGATAEFAHLRVWRTLINQEADFTAESASATPVITSGLILSLPMDSRAANTDQGPNGFTLTETGTITDGASDPPPGPAGGGVGATVELSLHGARRNRPGRGPYSLGRFFRQRIDAFNTVADVSQALSGQSITAELGTLTPSTSKALSGQQITVSPGTLAPALSNALTGQAASASAGTLAPALSLALSGQAITIAQGSVTAGNDVTAALSGQQISTAQGTLLPTLTLPLAGSQANFAQGNVSAGNDVTRALSGQQITSMGGTLGPALAKALAGQAATFAQGSVTPQQGFVVALTGQAITTALGSLTVALSRALSGTVFQATAGTIGVVGQIPPADARAEFDAISFDASDFDAQAGDDTFFDPR
jgi:hypothetical protein